MRLYHWLLCRRIFDLWFSWGAWRLRPALAALLGGLLLLAACSGAVPETALLAVQLTVDGQIQQVSVPAGLTVQQVLDTAQVQLDRLDRVEPPVTTVLKTAVNIRVIRVAEKLETTREILPFERRTVKNESLPADREILLQKGQNGLQEISRRHVYEDGVELDGQPALVRTTILEEPVPEIVMIGVQAPFFPLAITGRILYVRDGSVWMMEGSTHQRQALVTSGDLDGRILSLSPDGNWLLFTRKSSQEGQINRLWAAQIGAGEERLIDLKVPNVVHFADWSPGTDLRIVFSTVEPRPAAPGWQANNDLKSLTFSPTGWTSKWSEIIEPNSGGIYGWWGTSFHWSSGGTRLAFSRPDSIGLVAYKEGRLDTLFKLTPVQTRGDWAWEPGLAWGADGKAIYAVEHTAPAGAVAPEQSPDFDLTVIPLEGGAPIRLASQVGMFAYPQASPVLTQTAEATGYETAYRLAYLQAIFPAQSETSRYRVAVMNRDGSGKQILFPPADSPGLSPQREWGAWSPRPLPESGEYALAVLYQGNLWLIDLKDQQAHQITGDGLTSRVLWK